MNISNLSTERQWRSAIGMNKERFYILLPFFESSYLSIYKKTIATKQQQEKRIQFRIKSEEELLFFTLFSLKNDLTYDVLGLVFDMTASNAKRNQNISLKVLKHALDKQDYMPKRHFRNKKEFDSFFKWTKEIIIDATEQPIQKPSEKKRQKQHFSGKKNSIL